MFCCPNCFTHAFLKDHIKNYSKQKGKCSFCNYKGKQTLYKPASLIDLFQPLFDLYMEGNGGHPLVELLQFDWHVFSKIIDKKKQTQLISKIAGVNGLSSKRFISTLVQNNELLGRWDDWTGQVKTDT